MMQQLFLIGIGTGNPDHVTEQARQAMRQADVILIPRKGSGKTDLAELRRDICASVLGAGDARIVEFDMPVRDNEIGYLDAVDAWHDAIAAVWQASVPPKALRVALLIWGDPSLYDSSLRIAARLHPAPRLTVIPGITSLQALTAAHAIPLNDIAAPVVITTGRRLRDHGWPDAANRVAVMLDGGCAFQTLPDPEQYRIWWGAYVGMDTEILKQGRLNAVTEAIIETRAAARARHGWIMDIYLLEREQSARPTAQ